jgi:hypothetical protein
MSDENNENKEQKGRELKISVDRSKEIEDLVTERDNARSEAEGYKSTLSILAQNDFDQKKKEVAQRLGIDESTIDTPEKLTALRDYLRVKEGSDALDESGKAPSGNAETAILNEAQVTGKTGSTQKSSEDFSKANEVMRKYSPRPLALSVWHTEQEMFTELSARAKSGDEEAKKALDDMLYKQLNSPKREPIDLEFDSRVIRQKEKKEIKKE